MFDVASDHHLKKAVVCASGQGVDWNDRRLYSDVTKNVTLPYPRMSSLLTVRMWAIYYPARPFIFIQGSELGS